MQKVVQLEEYLSPIQSVMLYGESRFAAIIAAKGAGKTFLVPRIIDERLRQEPHAVGLITWASRQQALDVFNDPEHGVKKVLESYGWKVKLNQQDMFVTINGRKAFNIRVAEQDIRNLETVEYGWWIGDEISAYSYEHLKTFMSRVRTPKTSRMVRLFSMPDSPENPMYDWMEKQGFEMYEIPLTENPNSDFRDFYLKQQQSTYSGAEFERYVEGKRVRMADADRVFINFSELNIIDAEYKEGYPIYVSLDFNKKPMCGGVFQIRPKASLTLPELPNGMKFADLIAVQINEFALYPTANSEVLYSDIGHWIARNNKEHSSDVIINGDTTGNNASQGTNMKAYQEIKTVLINHFDYSRIYIKPNKANPSVEGSADVTNKLFRDSEGVIRFVVAKQCKQSIIAYNGVRWEDGTSPRQIDKSKDLNPSPETPLSHFVDLTRYFAAKNQKNIVQ